LDIRLVDDTDSKDETGLALARDIAGLGRPTLVLTAHPKYEFVRRAQTWFPDGTPSHINFVDKDESRETILNVVRGSLRGRNIFIVHGHAEQARQQVELFIHEIGLVPIVLQNQPHGGRTIIQQLEYYSNVAYVLVLLTPDDLCQDQNGAVRAQARQNVILELGYFIGKYTTKRVTGLVFGELVLPSDIHGLLYISVNDTNNWKETLVRELRSAGLHAKYP
jgi:predicted nucleotide-binding protein